jgi:murein L,D-transpeptidase YcbB/YkuD
MGLRFFFVNCQWLIVAALFVMATLTFSANCGLADDGPAATATASPSALGQVLSAPAQNELIDLVRTGNLAGLRWPNFVDYRDQVFTFYEAGAYALAWVRNSQPTLQALALIQLFKTAEEEGLNPDDYDSPRWDDRVARLQAPSADAVHFDLALTVCAMRYVSDLHVGRVNPQHFKFGLDVGPKRYDLTDFLRNQVVYSQDVKLAVAAVEPRYAGYARLKAKLEDYLKLAAAGDAGPVPIPGETVRPGDNYSGMAQLVARLNQLGDTVPDGSNESGASSVYQGGVIDAVRHFQRRHGLTSDGFLGKGTVEALNTPLRVRVQQIQFALERYRWIPSSFSYAPIVVNIP